MIDRLDAWLNEPGLVVRDTIERELVGRIDASNAARAIGHLEGDAHATELDRAIVVEALAPEGLRAVAAYARALPGRVADEDAAGLPRDAPRIYERVAGREGDG